MTRIAIAILITVLAFGALIILAGHMDWYSVSYRVTSDAIDVIDAIDGDEPTPEAPPSGARMFSDPAAWPRDFMRGALASADCPTDTVRNLRARMAAVGPYTVDEFERTVATVQATRDDPGAGIVRYNRASELTKRSITEADRIYVFGFTSASPGGDTTGFSGYFVAHDECVVHVEVTSYDN
jgi:hypothetical protein